MELLKFDEISEKTIANYVSKYGIDKELLKRDIKSGNVFVYKIQDEFVGYCRVAPYKIKCVRQYDKIRYFVTEFYILPNFRGIGLGTKFIQEVANKIPDIHIQTYFKLLEFYEKAGFVKIKPCNSCLFCDTTKLQNSHTLKFQFVTF